MRALAFDIGATHCRLALVSATDIQTLVSDGGNASTDIDSAASAIISAIDALARKVSTSSSELASCPAYIGMAGVIDADIAQALRERLPLEHVKIEDDRLNALRGALGRRDGFVVHCGTGSFFAKQRTGHASFAGGWGPVLEDIASANWVGVQALRQTLYAEDGLLSHTEMTLQLLKEHGGTAGIVDHAKCTQAGEIGLIAKTVTHYALQNDEVAVSVLQKGAAHIAEKLHSFGHGDSSVVCLTGGIAQQYKAYLPISVQACVVEALGEPLDGAVSLAREFYEKAQS